MFAKSILNFKIKRKSIFQSIFFFKLTYQSKLFFDNVIIDLNLKLKLI